MVTAKPIVTPKHTVPRKCGLAFKAPDGWHQCHLPKGHKGNHESWGWVHDPSEPLYDEPMNSAKPIQFREK